MGRLRGLRPAPPGGAGAGPTRQRRGLAQGLSWARSAARYETIHDGLLR